MYLFAGAEAAAKGRSRKAESDVALLEESKRWHDSAQQLISFADQATDEIAKYTLLGIAAGYERMAQLAEERLHSLEGEHPIPTAQARPAMK